MKYKKAVFMARSFLKRLCLKNSIKHWLKWKDDLNMYEAGHIKHNRQHHIRSIKKRDYGRLFHCRKFYYDPFWNGEEEIDYYEELERLREIEGFKE